MSYFVGLFILDIHIYIYAYGILDLIYIKLSPHFFAPGKKAPRDFEREQNKFLYICHKPKTQNIL